MEDERATEAKLEGKKYTLSRHFNEVGIQHFTGEASAKFEIPLPPLAEQQRILRLLDEAYVDLATARANAEKNCLNARALFDNHLCSFFAQRGKGWLDRPVSDIAKHSLGKMLDEAKNKGEPKPYLRYLNVHWFTFDLRDVLQMPFRADEVERCTAIKGDVLVCEGGYPGRAAVWNGEEPIYFQKALHRVRFHEADHNKWFVYFLYASDKSGSLSGTSTERVSNTLRARAWRVFRSPYLLSQSCGKR